MHRIENYTSEVPGVTSCPDCDVDLQPVASEGEPPIQSVTQACSECDYETPIGMVWYTTSRYEVVSEIDGDVSGECDRCEKEPVYAVIGTGLGVAIYYCDDCVPAHDFRASWHSKQ